MSKDKEASPAYQMYAKEWLSCSDVMIMEPHQEGAYIRLINYDWVNDGIPDNRRVLSQLSRISETDLDIVVKKFSAHPKKPAYLSHPRVQKERRKQSAFKKAKSKAGKQGAKKRWSKQPQTPNNELDKQDSTAIAHPLAGDNSPSPIPSPTAIAIDKDNKKRGRKLPTLTEWLDYAKEKDYPKDDAESAFDHYTANGWKQNKGNLIKDWKAALRTCKRFYEKNWKGNTGNSKGSGRKYTGYIPAPGNPENDYGSKVI